MENEVERALNVDGYEASYNTVKAATCKHGKREIRNNSVYCNLLDQYVSVNYCANACRKHEENKP